MLSLICFLINYVTKNKGSFQLRDIASVYNGIFEGTFKDIEPKKYITG